MDISISEQNQERIRRKVESGIYKSADDVVGTALGLLERLDAWLEEGDEALERELADMYEKVRIGAEQADKGMLIPGEEVIAELRRRNAEIVREKR